MIAPSARSARPLRLVAVLIGLAVLGASLWSRQQSEAVEPPNIVLVFADDADKASMEALPNIDALIAQQGMSFERFYATQPVCCPSRASLLLGRYSHNHKVWTNTASRGGGFSGFRKRKHENATIARELRTHGYVSGLFGKYLNEYGPASGSEGHVPRYWNRWFATFDAKYYRYTVNDEGRVRTFGRRSHSYATSVFGNRARRWIGRVRDRKPFFAFVSMTAPHSPYVDPPNHRGEYSGDDAPSESKPSFNEDDVSDKPRYIRTRPRLSGSDVRGIRNRYRHRMRMLLALDDFVGKLVGDLQASGELDNTYIFVTSDNGWMQGEHRRRAQKGDPYEESVRLPLFVRGPGITPGTTTHDLVSMVDLYATFADLAGGSTLRDGRSIATLLDGTATDWRDGVLVEWPSRVSAIPGYRALVTERYKYVRYATGERELYDLLTDPFETDSLHASADPALVEQLKTQLRALEKCAGASCRTADGGPHDPP